MLLEDLVNNNLSKLNPTDLIVWRYIYAHKKECCYISIYDIADACNVSRTTVLRFAKKLGLPATGASDCHVTDKVGVYATYFPDEIRSSGDLVRAVKAGRCSPAYYKEGSYHIYDLLS